MVFKSSMRPFHITLSSFGSNYSYYSYPHEYDLESSLENESNMAWLESSIEKSALVN